MNATESVIFIFRLHATAPDTVSRDHCYFPSVRRLTTRKRLRIRKPHLNKARALPYTECNRDIHRQYRAGQRGGDAVDLLWGSAEFELPQGHDLTSSSLFSSSVPHCKCQESTFNHATTASFHILSDSAFATVPATDTVYSELLATSVKLTISSNRSYQLVIPCFTSFQPAVTYSMFILWINVLSTAIIMGFPGGYRLSVRQLYGAQWAQ